MTHYKYGYSSVDLTELKAKTQAACLAALETEAIADGFKMLLLNAHESNIRIMVARQFGESYEFIELFGDLAGTYHFAPYDNCWMDAENNAWVKLGRITRAGTISSNVTYVSLPHILSTGKAVNKPAPPKKRVPKKATV